ncbi:MAG: DUF4838 domain-containing protein [Flavobacteriales bacterium]|nr:DUF4838 domain-containing protein [Flavobacteriales bacterium]
MRSSCSTLFGLIAVLALFSCTRSPKPPFTFRMAYYGPATDSAWAAGHHVRKVSPGFDGVDPEWGLWVHTMHRFVPATWIDAHPEYFAERNGIRITDQVCFSNKEVLRITVDSLRAMMRRKPAATYWSVSQLDNFNYCQCALCRQADSSDGSHIGSILHFVNAVADSFPEKVISTLAYQYSRTPPKVTRPRPNVNIMLCSIEEDRSKPIATRSGPGSFTADLHAWSAITHNIIVWDYVINFSHLLAPFPNWKVLQPNIRLFRDAGVPMVFEQGLSGPGGEMPMFRATLLADLLWNPDLDVDSLRTAFMDEFYGPDAGPYINEYTRLMEQELDKSGLPLTLYEHPQAHKDGYLSPANLARYQTLFTSAEAATMDGEPLYQQRVEAARLPIMYAELEIARALPGTPNGLFEKDASGQWQAKPYYTALLDSFVVRAKRHGNILLHETRLPPDEYRAQFSHYLKHGAVSHLAVGKTITCNTPPAAKYTGGSPGALIDGFRAGTNYQFAWQGWQGQDLVAVIDLGMAQRISSAAMGFLEDQASWIFLPTSVHAETSMDGNRWTALGKQDLPLRKQVGPPNIREVSITGGAEQARYVRVTAKNLGPLPAFHGSKGDCWLFCDEVVVK